MSLAELLKKRGVPQVTVQSHNTLPFGTQLFFTNVWGCGYGNYGRLAQGNEETHHRFVQGKALQENLNFIKLNCGAAHILALDTENRLWTWGKCSFGQLGHGYEDIDYYLPYKVETLSNVPMASIATGDSFSVAITFDGLAYTWGCGLYGVLGHNSEESFFKPKLVEGLTGIKIVQAAGGAFHVLYLTEDGSVYACGKNKFGTCGTGDRMNKRLPTLVEGLKGQKVVSVSCGNSHSICLTSSGEIYAMGSNSNGQLGKDTSIKIIETPTLLSLTEKKIISASCGNHHTIFLDEAGVVYVVGEATTKNEMVQVVEMPQDARVVEVAAGEAHFVVRDEKGRVYTWGENNFGKLGRSLDFPKPGLVCDLEDKTIFCVQGGSNHTVVLTEKAEK